MAGGELMNTEVATDNISALYHSHFAWLRAYVLRQTRDEQLSHDIASQTLDTLGRQSPGVPEHCHASWILTTSRRLLWRHRRSESRRRKRESVAFFIWCKVRADAPDPGFESHTRELYDLLESAIDQLSGLDREAVILRYYGHLAYSEIGQRLNVSAEAARKRVDRGVAQLRQQLRKSDAALHLRPFVLVGLLWGLGSAKKSLAGVYAKVLATTSSVTSSAALPAIATAAVAALAVMAPLAWQGPAAGPGGSRSVAVVPVSAPLANNAGESPALTNDADGLSMAAAPLTLPTDSATATDTLLLLRTARPAVLVAEARPLWARADAVRPFDLSIARPASPAKPAKPTLPALSPAAMAQADVPPPARPWQGGYALKLDAHAFIPSTDDKADASNTGLTLFDDAAPSSDRVASKSADKPRPKPADLEPIDDYTDGLYAENFAPATGHDRLPIYTGQGGKLPAGQGATPLIVQGQKTGGQSVGGLDAPLDFSTIGGGLNSVTASAITARPSIDPVAGITLSTPEFTASQTASLTSSSVISPSPSVPEPTAAGLLLVAGLALRRRRGKAD